MKTKLTIGTLLACAAILLARAAIQPPDDGVPWGRGSNSVAFAWDQSPSDAGLVDGYMLLIKRGSNDFAAGWDQQVYVKGHGTTNATVTGLDAGNWWAAAYTIGTNGSTSDLTDTVEFTTAEQPEKPGTPRVTVTVTVTVR